MLILAYLRVCFSLSQEELDLEEEAWTGVGPCLRPQLVKRLVGENVHTLSCGRHHVLALTTGGDLFVWGRNARVRKLFRRNS